MTTKEEATRLVAVSRKLAVVSLLLLLVSTVIQITRWEASAVTLALNTFTIGVLSATATLIGKTVRNLERRDR